MEKFDGEISDLLENKDQYTETLIEYGTAFVGAILVFIIGRIIAKFVVKLFSKSLEKAKVDETLTSFLSNVAYAVLLAFVIISALGTLGVNTTSFAAAIAAAGLAIGLAFQNSLSNLAAGVMIIIFKFFNKGEYVEVAGTAGTIDAVTVFTTTLKTPDNKTITIPNSSITSNNIINYSREKTRRVDMVFCIDYKDSIKLAKETLEKLLSEDERILKDPEPIIAVGELADSSINILCRPWVKTDDYWAVYWDMQEKVKERFDEAGLSIPFPQRDMHIYENKAE